MILLKIGKEVKILLFNVCLVNKKWEFIKKGNYSLRKKSNGNMTKLKGNCKPINIATNVKHVDIVQKNAQVLIVGNARYPDIMLDFVRRNLSHALIVVKLGTFPLSVIVTNLNVGNVVNQDT